MSSAIASSQAVSSASYSDDRTSTDRSTIAHPLNRSTAPSRTHSAAYRAECNRVSSFSLPGGRPPHVLDALLPPHARRPAGSAVELRGVATAPRDARTRLAGPGCHNPEAARQGAQLFRHCPDRRLLAGRDVIHLHRPPR